MSVLRRLCLLMAIPLALDCAAECAVGQGSNFGNSSGAVFFTPLDFTNTTALMASDIGLDASDQLLSLSSGQEPLEEALWDIVFSVDIASAGLPGTAVSATLPISHVNIFFTNMFNFGSNSRAFSGMTVEADWGLGPSDVVDALEIIGVNLACLNEPLAPMFMTGDNVYFTAAGANIPSSADILLSAGSGSNSVFAGSVTMGLVPGDVIDALALLDSGTPQGLDPDVDRAVFSFAPGSPSLPVGGSPADLFFTDFDGTFAIASSTNLSLGAPGVSLTASTLGLNTSDNVDALDVSCTSAGGLGVLPIPTVSEWGLIVMTLLGVTIGIFILGRRRANAGAAAA